MMFHPFQKAILNSFLLAFIGLSTTIISLAQTFPNPVALSTGQGTVGALDPVWTVSQWYTNPPGSPNTSAPTYTPALINNNCAPGAWITPMAGTNWITGQDANCATNSNSGYRYFRLTLNLPPDCNGFSVTNPGSFSLNFFGYADNSITEVYINGNPTGISGGSFAAGSGLNIALNGPWQVGVNYVDILVYNFPSSGGGSNPYGLLLQANTTAPTDTDNDGVPNTSDLCPCDPGTNPYGCTDPTLFNCNISAIRAAMANQNCIEIPLCSDDCSIYFLNKTSMTGAQAQAFANNFGANLISIQNQAENDCIMNALNNLNDPTVSSIIWIGFSDEITEGSFIWYDGAPITYTNWAPGEPNNVGPSGEDCVQIYPNGSWNDLPCNSSNAQSIIEFNLCPVINAGSDHTICINQTANIQPTPPLFGSSPYTYSWNNGPTTINNPVTPNTTTTYVVSVIDRYNCVFNDTVVVNVNPLPIVVAPNDTAFCIGNSITLNGAGANTYVWDQNITNGVAFNPNTTQTYTVTGTDANNCQNTDQVTITVNPLPVVNAGNDFSVCPNSLITLSGSGAQNYTWDQNIGNNQSFHILQTNTYTVTGTDANNCQNTDQITVTVFPTPVVNAGADQAICLNQTTSLNATGAQNYTWDNGITNGQTFSPTQTLTYTVIGTDANNCNDTDDVVITVYPLPNVNAGQDQAICIGATATLSGTGANQYSWDQGVLNNNPFNPTQTNTYTVTGTDANNCQNTDQVVVTVHNLPIIDAGPDQQICIGSSTQLTASGAISYVWNNGIFNNTPFSPTNTTTYTVTGTDVNNCVNTDQVTITIITFPIPGFETNSPAQVLLKPLEITSTASNYTLLEYYLNGVLIGSGTNITYDFMDAGHYEVLQIATNIMCVDSLRETIEVLPGANIFIPNSFTPKREDNINDIWKPIITYLEDYQLLIFDRWGSIVLKSDNIYEGWNGGFHNDLGKPVMAGSYVYKIQYRHLNGPLKELSGFVNLIR